MKFCIETFPKDKLDLNYMAKALFNEWNQTKNKEFEKYEHELERKNIELENMKKKLDEKNNPKAKSIYLKNKYKSIFDINNIY